MQSLVKMGRLAALRFFGLEKLAGPYDAIDHAIGRGLVRFDWKPRFSDAVLKEYLRQGAPSIREPGLWHTPFWGVGKAIPSVRDEVARVPKAILGYTAGPRGSDITTVLPPEYGTRHSKLVRPQAPFHMPTEGRHLSESLPNMSEILDNPEPHMDLLKHLVQGRDTRTGKLIGALDKSDLARWPAVRERPGLAEHVKRLGLQLPEPGASGREPARAFVPTPKPLRLNFSKNP